MKLKNIITSILLICTVFCGFASANTSKKERNLIVGGNEAYSEGNYAKAIEQYRQALTINPTSEIAEFNLATALINSSKSIDVNSEPLKEAVGYFNRLSKSNNKRIAQKSLFNLGHVAYNQKDYTTSIDYYKMVLRQNPDNDKAREYLRMAQMQLKKQQQQNQQQKKEENEDKENNNENEQKKEQDKEKESQQNNDQQQSQKQQPQPVSINEANAEKILKSIEKKEQETLIRLNKQRSNAKQMQQAGSRVTDKPW